MAKQQSLVLRHHCHFLWMSLGVWCRGFGIVCDGSAAHVVLRQSFEGGDKRRVPFAPIAAFSSRFQHHVSSFLVCVVTPSFKFV